MQKIKNVIIVGGGRIGKNVADNLLSSGFNVKIIDSNYETCKQLSDRFSDALIINADVSDESIFEEEQLYKSDLIICTTENPEINILAAVYAKRLGIKKAISVISQNNYITMASTLGIDATVSPKNSSVDRILKYIRKGNIESIHSLFDGRVEVIEFKVSEESELCKKACREIFKVNTSPDKLHNYSKALAIYTNHFGTEAMPFLLKAVDNSDKAFRYSALNLAEKMDDVATTRQWIAKAGTVSDETKAEIIDMLGRKGDVLAVNFMKENLLSPSGVVRTEAINALLKLEGSKAVPVLTEHMAKGQDLEVAKTALQQLLSQKHLAPVAAQLDKTSGKTKAAFVDLIAAKSGTAFFDKIFALTKSGDADEKTAAFRALKKVSTEKNMDNIIGLLLAVNNESEIRETQLAFVAAAKGVEQEKTENGKLLT
ncbi:MAG: hypothetical protein EOM73_15695, partial [Bacteroidia bacterium]|nr:hypothetical protein [Bacteroidia bacterium]